MRHRGGWKDKGVDVQIIKHYISACNFDLVAFIVALFSAKVKVP